jgi:putative GTP pyrophosphokinase
MTFANILEVNGLTEQILLSLSYKSNLGISLKKNLHYFNETDLLNELYNITEWYDSHNTLFNIPIDYRIKSKESIKTKYKRYYPDHQTRKVFNDILGLRAFCDDYKEVLNINNNSFKIVDLTSGKSNDDGYRGVHVYFQKDNYHYPIEIQFNTLYDRQLNNWLHDYLYKKTNNTDIGKYIRKEYEQGRIKNINEFKEVLNNVLSSC